MSKICTNIEQSKRLLELGIDPETSDMYWRELRYSEPVEYSLNYRPREMMLTSRTIAFPAWSLSALFELMPATLYDKEVKSLHVGYRGSRPHFEYVVKTHDTEWYPEGYRPIYESSTSDKCKTWLDAAFEMVCWLLKNNYLNKE